MQIFCSLNVIFHELIWAKEYEFWYSLWRNRKTGHAILDPSQILRLKHFSAHAWILLLSLLVYTFEHIWWWWYYYIHVHICKYSTHMRHFVPLDFMTWTLLRFCHISLFSVEFFCVLFVAYLPFWCMENEHQYNRCKSYTPSCTYMWHAASRIRNIGIWISSWRRRWNTKYKILCRSFSRCIYMRVCVCGV